MSEPQPRLEAVRYEDGTVSFPAHHVGSEGGEPIETVDLTDRTATVVTWTSSTATPPGVRAPNHLAIVEFDLGAEGTVRAIGQLTTDDVTVGSPVRPVYVDELRDPRLAVRHPDSQRWDGYRFEPV